MTNREWLESLSDEELAYILDREPCEKRCTRYEGCMQRIFAGECSKQIAKWLQAEHKNEE